MTRQPPQEQYDAMTQAQRLVAVRDGNKRFQQIAFGAGSASN
jgi:hypothetical protein